MYLNIQRNIVNKIYTYQQSESGCPLFLRGEEQFCYPSISSLLCYCLIVR